MTGCWDEATNSPKRYTAASENKIETISTRAPCPRRTYMHDCHADENMMERRGDPYLRMRALLQMRFDSSSTSVSPQCKMTQTLRAQPLDSDRKGSEAGGAPYSES